MPKQKTHKGTKKRFRLSANGKIKHRSAGTSHLAARMTQKRVRKLRGTTVMATAMAKQIKKALAKHVPKGKTSLWLEEAIIEKLQRQGIDLDA